MEIEKIIKLPFVTCEMRTIFLFEHIGSWGQCIENILINYESFLNVHNFSNLQALEVKSKLSTATSFLSKGIIINLTESENVDVIVGNTLFSQIRSGVCTRQKTSRRVSSSRPSKKQQRLSIQISIFPCAWKVSVLRIKKARG